MKELGSQMPILSEQKKRYTIIGRHKGKEVEQEIAIDESPEAIAELGLLPGQILDYVGAPAKVVGVYQGVLCVQQSPNEPVRPLPGKTKEDFEQQYGIKYVGEEYALTLVPFDDGHVKFIPIGRMGRVREYLQSAIDVKNRFLAVMSHCNPDKSYKEFNPFKLYIDQEDQTSIRWDAVAKDFSNWSLMREKFYKLFFQDYPHTD